MRPAFIFRLDDICPTMDWANFFKLRAIFRKYKIKPLAGLVPDNQDKQLKVDSPRPNYWAIMRELEAEGWVICQHGYRHVVQTSDSGEVGINAKSEFAGLSYDKQVVAIRAGKKILDTKLGSAVKWWMAPWHSSDANTYKALVKLGFKYVTDGMGLHPYSQNGLTFYPQQLWRPIYLPFGVWTVCIHLNTINTDYLVDLEKFLAAYHRFCPSPTSLTVQKLTAIDKLFELAWRVSLRLVK